MRLDCALQESRLNLLLLSVLIVLEHGNHSRVELRLIRHLVVSRLGGRERSLKVLKDRHFLSKASASSQARNDLFLKNLSGGWQAFLLRTEFQPSLDGRDLPGQKAKTSTDAARSHAKVEEGHATSDKSLDQETAYDLYCEIRGEVEVMDVASVLKWLLGRGAFEGVVQAMVADMAAEMVEEVTGVERVAERAAMVQKEEAGKVRVEATVALRALASTAEGAE